MPRLPRFSYPKALHHVINGASHLFEGQGIASSRPGRGWPSKDARRP